MLQQDAARQMFDPAVTVLIGVVVGAALGFALSELKERLARWRRYRAHWRALSAETGLCREMAEGFIRDDRLTPLYRLPVLSHLHSFPLLLADGAVTGTDAQAVTRFFNEVETLNRGLDQVHESRTDESRAQEEHRRNQLKAQRLCGSGERYRAIGEVLDKHIK